MSEHAVPGLPGVAADHFRSALSRWASGVTVVTAGGPDGPIGLTASSFSSLSLHPPLVLVCVGEASFTHDAITRAPGFAVHVLRDDQRSWSERFAARGADRFAGLELEAGPFGAPLIEGTLARLVCEHHAVAEGGDHTILMGRVVEVEVGEGDPLLYVRSGYRRVGDDAV